MDGNIATGTSDASIVPDGVGDCSVSSIPPIIDSEEIHRNGESETSSIRHEVNSAYDKPDTKNVEGDEEELDEVWDEDISFTRARATNVVHDTSSARTSVSELSAPLPSPSSASTTPAKSEFTPVISSFSDRNILLQSAFPVNEPLRYREWIVRKSSFLSSSSLLHLELNLFNHTLTLCDKDTGGNMRLFTLQQISSVASSPAKPTEVVVRILRESSFTLVFLNASKVQDFLFAIQDEINVRQTGLWQDFEFSVIVKSVAQMTPWFEDSTSVTNLPPEASASSTPDDEVGKSSKKEEEKQDTEAIQQNQEQAHEDIKEPNDSDENTKPNAVNEIPPTSETNSDNARGSVRAAYLTPNSVAVTFRSLATYPTATPLLLVLDYHTRALLVVDNRQRVLGHILLDVLQQIHTVVDDDRDVQLVVRMRELKLAPGKSTTLTITFPTSCHRVCFIRSISSCFTNSNLIRWDSMEEQLRVQGVATQDAQAQNDDASYDDDSLIDEVPKIEPTKDSTLSIPQDLLAATKGSDSSNSRVNLPLVLSGGLAPISRTGYPQFAAFRVYQKSSWPVLVRLGSIGVEIVPMSTVPLKNSGDYAELDMQQTFVLPYLAFRRIEKTHHLMPHSASDSLLHFPQRVLFFLNQLSADSPLNLHSSVRCPVNAFPSSSIHSRLQQRYQYHQLFSLHCDLQLSPCLMFADSESAFRFESLLYYRALSSLFKHAPVERNSISQNSAFWTFSHYTPANPQPASHSDVRSWNGPLSIHLTNWNLHDIPFQHQQFNFLPLNAQDRPDIFVVCLQECEESQNLWLQSFYQQITGQSMNTPVPEASLPYAMVQLVRTTSSVLIVLMRRSLFESLDRASIRWSRMDQKLAQRFELGAISFKCKETSFAFANVQFHEKYQQHDYQQLLLGLNTLVQPPVQETGFFSNLVGPSTKTTVATTAAELATAAATLPTRTQSSDAVAAKNGPSGGEWNVLHAFDHFVWAGDVSRYLRDSKNSEAAANNATPSTASSAPNANGAEIRPRGTTIPGSSLAQRIESFIAAKDWSGLAKLDASGIWSSVLESPFSGFEELPLTFPPTFPLHKSKDSYISVSEQPHCHPCYPLRVFIRHRPSMASAWETLQFNSSRTTRFSIQRPVFGVFRVHLRDAYRGPDADDLNDLDPLEGADRQLMPVQVLKSESELARKLSVRTSRISRLSTMSSAQHHLRKSSAVLKSSLITLPHSTASSTVPNSIVEHTPNSRPMSLANSMLQPEAQRLAALVLKPSARVFISAEDAIAMAEVVSSDNNSASAAVSAAATSVDKSKSKKDESDDGDSCDPWSDTIVSVPYLSFESFIYPKQKAEDWEDWIPPTRQILSNSLHLSIPRSPSSYVIGRTETFDIILSNVSVALRCSNPRISRFHVHLSASAPFFLSPISSSVATYLAPQDARHLSSQVLWPEIVCRPFVHDPYYLYSQHMQLSLDAQQMNGQAKEHIGTGCVSLASIMHAVFAYYMRHPVDPATGEVLSLHAPKGEHWSQRHVPDAAPIPLEIPIQRVGQWIALMYCEISVRYGKTAEGSSVRVVQ